MNKAIFDREKLAYNRQKMHAQIAKSKFFQYSAEDIIERLSCIKNEFINILDIEPKLLKKLLHSKYQNAKIETSTAENLPFKQKFDLITCSQALHWINNIQEFLAQVHNMLKPNGIFIGNFIGGDSLLKLKLKFIEAEIMTDHPHYQRISPFIKFEHVPALLRQAGFHDIIVDYERVMQEYKCPLDLIHAIKDIGESGSLIQKQYYTISKGIYKFLSDSQNLIQEEFDIISFIASPIKAGIKLTSYSDGIYERI